MTQQATNHGPDPHTRTSKFKLPPLACVAFSSEVDAGSREENASRQKWRYS
jgi:hypothetical protein